jgi:post-segregation antitoxin (ccd killing protein)
MLATLFSQDFSTWSYVFCFMKKSALLYLDSDLVETANRGNINISRLTEEALKQALEVERPRTSKEHLRKLLAEVGNEISFYGETYLLPFQIESLKLTKVGPFDNFEAHFSRNSINLIHGSCGSGKSTIIRSILYAFGIRHKHFTERVLSEGTITVKLFPRQDFINVTGMKSGQNALRGYKCVVGDDSLERILKDMIAPFFAELKHLGIQIILTASPLIDTSKLPNDIRIITTYDQC